MSGMTRTLLTLDATHPRVRVALLDVQHMHRLVMTGYPDTGSEGSARASLGVLYAADPDPRDDTLRVIVQSPHAGEWGAPEWLRDEPTTWTMPDLVEGRYAFHLTANPTRRARETRQVVALTRPDEQIDWLHRKADASGLTIHDATALPGPSLRSSSKSLPRAQRRHPGDEFRIAPVTYRGTLTVTDPDTATTARNTGIGRGKAYGCGLLLTHAA